MPKITFEVDLADNASPALQQIVAQAKAAGVDISEGFKPATSAINQHAAATQGLTGLVREDRQEHRMRMYAIREATGSLQMMTGADNDLAKSLNAGTSMLFQMDFALKGVAEMGSKVGGVVGSLAAGLGSAAMPLAAVIGGFFLAKNAAAEAVTRVEALKDEVRGLDEALGNIPADKLGDTVDKVNEAMTTLKSGPTAWEKIVGNAIEAVTFQWNTFRERWQQEHQLLAQKAEDVMQKEAADELAVVKKLEEETVKISTQSSLTQISNSQDTANAKIVNAEIVEFEQMAADKRTAIAATKGHANQEAEISAIETEYRAKSIALQATYTTKYKEELKSRESAARSSAESIATLEIAIARAKQGGGVDETALQKLSRDKVAADATRVVQEKAAVDQEIAEKQGDANTARVRKDFHEKQLLADQEYNNAVAGLNKSYALSDMSLQTMIAKQYDDLARDEELEHDRTQQQKLATTLKYGLMDLDAEQKNAEQARIRERGKTADLTQIDQSYELRRQLLRQTTVNKIAELDKKEAESHHKAILDMEQMENVIESDIATGFGNAIGQAIVSAQSLGDAFVKVGERIVEQLITMIAEQTIFNILAGLLSGGASEVLSLATPNYNPTTFLPGHSTGADFVVPGGFERDNYPLGFASSGEHVSITPAGGSQQGGGPTIVFNVNAVDAKSFSDFLRQGGIRDALMGTIQRAVRMGKT